MPSAAIAPENKKAQHCELGNLYKTEFLAPRAGLEPATCGLTERFIF